MKYRADIDGLRAIAVLAVIFYHAGFTGLMAGGFVGVDIFFVISGFLITNIIYKQCQNNSFSLLNFYERRVRRIIPVFLLVVAVSIFLAWHLFIKIDFNKFCNSLYSTLIVGSNFFFWRDVDYFLPDLFKPLLHTWSLAIEEQFYIIFPLFLLYLVRKKINVQKTLFALFFISFASCVAMSFWDRNAAFYLLPFRAWELTIGAMLAVKVTDTGRGFCKTAQEANLIGILGLGLLAVSILFISSKTFTFPGYIALFPCLGALFCIESGLYENSISRKILGFSWLKNIGLISYSLYLWHWGILVFMKYYALNEQLNTQWLIGYFITIFALSFLSYKLLEQPIRKKQILTNYKTLFATCFLIAVLLAGIALVGQKNVFERKLLPRIEAFKVFYTDRAEYVNKIPELSSSKYLYNKLHKIGTAPENDFILFGNSHAEMLVDLFREFADKYNLSGLYYHSPMALQGLIEDGNSALIGEQEEFAKLYPKLNVKYAFIAMRWSGVMEAESKYILDEQQNKDYSINKFSSSLNATIDLLQKNGTKVYLLLPTPELPFDAARKATLLNEDKLDLRENTKFPLAQHQTKQSELMPIFNELTNKNVSLVNPGDMLCDDNFCYAAIDNKVLYFDDDHLSKTGVKYIQELIEPFFVEITKHKNP